MRPSRRRLLGIAAAAAALVLVQLEPASVSAAPSVTWERSVARSLNSVVADGAGHVYATGFRVDQDSRRKDRFMVLYRYSSSGHLLWRREWRPSHAWSEGRDLAIGDDGAVYLSGLVNPDGYEGSQWFIRKYSPAGVLLWRHQTRNWRRPFLVGHAEAISGIAVGAGMVSVSGVSFGCCGDVDRDGWVRTYDLDGHLLWTDPFEASRPSGTNDSAEAIAIGGIGRVYVAGWVATTSEVEGDWADHEIMVQKLGPSGGVVWTHVFLDHHRRDLDGATGVSVRGSRLVVAAAVGGNRRGRPAHAWLASLTFDGGVRWTRTWGTENGRSEQPSSVSLDPAGSSYVAGTGHDRSGGDTNAFVRKYSKSGSLRWELALGDGQSSTNGSDVFALLGGALATGWQSTGDFSQPSGGWLWRLRG